VVALPNVLPKEMQETLRPYNLKPVTLGLDLQGGSNVLLEVDRVDLRERLSQQLTSDIRGTLREAKVGYSGLNRFDNSVRVRVTKPEDMEKAETELRTLLKPLETGLFGAGGHRQRCSRSRGDQQFTFSFSDPVSTPRSHSPCRSR
jgi:preprotein translocase subunit SecD